MAVWSTREISFNNEAAFAENVVTYTNRIPVRSVNPTFTQQRGDDGSIQNRQNESRPGFQGVRSTAFEFTTDILGHNTASNGALTTTWLHTLLGNGLGGSDATQVGGAVLTGTPTVTSLPYAGATVVSGAVVRVGAKGDARADGQAAVINAVGSPATLLTALPVAPSNTDALYACLIAYPKETLATTERFSCAWNSTQASGAAYHAHGCQLASLACEIPLAGAALPSMTLGYRGANWQRSAYTVPSSNTLLNANAQPAAGGSLFVQTVGTTTRAVRSPVSMRLTVDLGLAPNEGPAAANAAYQVINGWERLRCVPTLEVVIPWGTGDETTWDTDGSGTTHQHILFTASTGDGSRAWGFYMPRAFLVGARPTYTNNQGLLYQTVTWRGREGTDTTNDLTRSAIRFFFG